MKNKSSKKPTQELELELEPVDEADLCEKSVVHQYKAVSAPAEKSEGMQMLDLIRQMATDPAFDPAKMQQIIDMRKDIFMENARIEFNKAMARVQAKILPVARDAFNKQTKSDYVKIESVIRAIAPLYTAEGFALSFSHGVCAVPEQTAKGWFRTICEITHAAGYSKTNYIDLPPDIAGIKGEVNKTAVHAVKSTTTYARGILICEAFNVPLADKVRDDDGNGAGGEVDATEYLNAEQVAIINSLIARAGMSMEEFLKRARVPSVETIPDAMFQTACNTLNRRVEIAERGTK